MKVKPAPVAKQSHIPGIYWHCGKMGWVQRQAIHAVMTTTTMATTTTTSVTTTVAMTTTRTTTTTQ